MTTKSGTSLSHIQYPHDAFRALFFLLNIVNNLWIQPGITSRKTHRITLAQTWVKSVRNVTLFKNQKLFYISSTPVHTDIHSTREYKYQVDTPYSNVFPTIHTPSNRSSILYKEI